MMDVHLNRKEKFRPPDNHAHKLHNLQGFHQNVYSLITLLSIVTNYLFVLPCVICQLGYSSHCHQSLNHY